MRTTECAPTDTETNNFIAAIDGDLSFASMQKANPSQHGKVLKLHVPLLWNIVPSSLLRLVQYCTSRLTPSWKERELIILGNYIYRFYDKSSRSIKGSPIALDEIDARFVTKRTDDTTSTPNYSYRGANIGGGAVEDLPPFCHAVFSVSSVGKTRFYAVATEEEAIAWVNSIRQGQQECVKRKMGHAGHVPYPSAWEYFDRMGERAVNKSVRIKEHVARQERRETEMTQLGDVPTGSMSMGYYG